jgi:hypothetical protein
MHSAPPSIYTINSLDESSVGVKSGSSSFKLQMTDISIDGHPATPQELYISQEIRNSGGRWEVAKQGESSRMNVDIGRTMPAVQQPGKPSAAMIPPPAAVNSSQILSPFQPNRTSIIPQKIGLKAGPFPTQPIVSVPRSSSLAESSVLPEEKKLDASRAPANMGIFAVGAAAIRQSGMFPPSFPIGKQGTVSKLEGETVVLKVDGRLVTEQKCNFTNAELLGLGVIVKVVAGGKWEVPDMQSIPSAAKMKPPTAVLPQKPLQPMASPQPVPLSPLRSADIPRQPPPTPPFQPPPPLPRPIIQPVKHNFIPISSLNDVFGSQMNPSLVHLQDQLLTKYPGLYWSRADTRGTRSIAAYALQCLLFERVILQQKPGYDMHLLSNSLSFSLDRLPNADISLRDPSFEERYREEIAYIDGQLPQLTNSDLQPLCSQLKVCLIVFKPTNFDNFEVEKLYPEGRWDINVHKIALIAKPPFPVLISHKIASILSHPIGICRISSFTLTKQKREPPPSDPVLTQKVTQLREFCTEGEKLARTLLLFVGKIVARFNAMIFTKELEEHFCSTEIGKGLHRCWELLGALTEQDFKELRDLASACLEVISAPWTHFTQGCHVCQREYRQFVLDCGHSLCGVCMSKHINSAMEERVMITVNLASTGLACPICLREISSSTLQKQEKNLYQRLLDQFASVGNCKVCDQCNQMRPNELVFKFCQHTCCAFCAKDSLITCKKCQSVIDLQAKAHQTAINCKNCSVLCNIWSLVPVMCGKQHVICIKCAYHAILRKSCLVQDCEKAYSESELHDLETLAVATCRHCGEIRPYSQLLKTKCSCIVCLTCFNTFPRSATCWFCGILLPAEFQSASSSSGVCFICGNAEGVANLLCGDSVHPYCLGQYVTAQCANEPMSRVNCKACGVELFAKDIYQLVENPPEKYALANLLQRDVQCPSCLNPVISISEDSNTVEQFNCTCGFNGCALCLNQWDTFHSGGWCMMKTAPEKLLELTKSKKPAIMCPYCRFVQVRTEGWQQCELPNCAQYFCYDCGVLYNTIEKHGPGYHRPDCSQHTGQVLTTTFAQDCIRCTYVGDAGCQAPQRLPRKGYIHAGLSYYR